MRKAQLLISVSLLVLLLVACAPTAAPSPAPAAPAPVSAPATAPVAAPAPASPTKPTWEATWEGMVQEAKKEGRVVLYVTLGGTERQMLVRAFENQYGVRVEAVTGSTNELSEKIAAQRRAGLYQVDLCLTGSTSIAALKSMKAAEPLDPVLVLPELTDPELIKKTWYFGQLSWMNKEHTVLTTLIDLKEPIVANTNLVKPGEITSYRDFLNPKWKGKLSLQDPSVGGTGQRWFAVVMETGAVDQNYIRALIGQGLDVTRDRRLQVEWLARGKHAIAIAPYTPAVTEFIQVGAPIDRFRLEPYYISAATSGITLPNRAPHPNATKLFINWLLSKEGQTVHSQAVGAQSQRLDVPTSHLTPSRILPPGVKAFDTDSEEFMLKRDKVYNPLAKEIFGSLR